MNHPQDVHAVIFRKIEDKSILEAFYSKYAQTLEGSPLETTMPTDVGLGREKSKGVMRR